MLHTLKSYSVRCALMLLVTVLLTEQPIDAAGSALKKHSPKEPVNMIKVPMTRQSTDYTCGVAAVQSVLMYYGDEFMEGVLSKDLKANPKVGTAYKEIVRLVKSKGYKVEVLQNMTIESLKSLIDSGKPVICLIQAWPEKKVNYATDWEDGHYVVAIGYDRQNVFFMDPSTLGNYTFIPTKEFLTRWHDTDSKVKLEHFGMVVEKAKPAYKAGSILKLE
ncbi:MAG: C39 family peptidase [Candidatus Melainabacteria bacterium]|nr:C39 family peptidase [Candidatus Melainabacteria bacterium]